MEANMIENHINNTSLLKLPQIRNHTKIIHVDTNVIKKHSFLIIIDTFSKQATTIYLEDRNSITLIEKLRLYYSLNSKRIVAVMNLIRQM